MNSFQDKNMQDCGLLVYIPCHQDHRQAKEQAIRLREQFASLNQQHSQRSQKLIIVISVNGVTLSTDEHQELISVSDELIYSRVSIGADANIALGFLKALERSPEFFWLLSANDRVTDGAVARILNVFYRNPNCDLVIADNNAESREFSVSDVLLKPMSGIHFGLISAVIYRATNTIENFPAAVKLNWTGWGQLAVIQTSCFTSGSLNIISIPGGSLYERDYDSSSSAKNSIKRNNAYYSHSFFGMPILIAALYAHDDRLRRKTLRSWLYLNWFRLHSFSSNFEAGHQIRVIDEPYWRQSISEEILKRNGTISRILFFCGISFAWERFRDSPMARIISK